MNISRVTTAALLALLLAAGGAGVAQAGDQTRTDDQTDLQQRIAVLEAGQKEILEQLQEIKTLLQARQAPPQPAAPQMPAVPPTVDLDIAGAAVKGRADAKVTVVEFSDFQCPFCGRYTKETLGQVEREYVDTGKVRYVFRNYPLERLHPQAKRAAEAAECARVQGKFWEMHTQLFANQQVLAEVDLLKHAQAAGVNLPPFQQCLAGQSAARVQQDMAEGMRAVITGTPTFFIGTTTKNGKVHATHRITGAQPFAAFKTAIDAVLNASAGK